VRPVASRGAFLPSPIFLAIVGLVLITGVAAWRGIGNPGIAVFGFVVAGWLLALSLHEYAHAVVAYLGGDRSVADRGYLTLNPLRYAHPLLSIGFPLLFIILGGIGLPGGAVAVERHRLRSATWDTAVSVAGPSVNVAFAVAGGLGLALGFAEDHRVFWAGVAFAAFLQLTVAILNLLPVPGLDGGNALFPWLSDRWRQRYVAAAPYGLFALLALFFVPQLNGIFFAAVFAAAALIGLSSGGYAEGYDLFTFWS
jgi:Zn-dependent protease